MENNLLTLFLLLPFGGACLAFALPSDRLRPWLLPLCGALHLVMTFVVIQAGPLSAANGWLCVIISTKGCALWKNTRTVIL